MNNRNGEESVTQAVAVREPDGSETEQQPAHEDITRRAEPQTAAQARPVRKQAEEPAR